MTIITYITNVRGINYMKFSAQLSHKEAKKRKIKTKHTEKTEKRIKKG